MHTISTDNISEWTKVLSSSCDEIPPTILAVNKIDIDDNWAATNEEILCKYSESFQHVIFTSAKTGEGTDDLFSHMKNLGYKFAKKEAKINTVPTKEENKGSEYRC